MKTLLTITLLLTLSAVYSQDRSEAFIVLKDAIETSFLPDYKLNESQTFDSRSALKITLDRNGDEYDRLIYSISPSSDKFSELNIALATEKYIWNERDALYQDGKETGMSSVVILLKNQAGKFTLTHRALGGEPFNKTKLEEILSNISWNKLEQ